MKFVCSLSKGFGDGVFPFDAATLVVTSSASSSICRSWESLMGLIAGSTKLVRPEIPPCCSGPPYARRYMRSKSTRAEFDTLNQSYDRSIAVLETFVPLVARMMRLSSSTASSRRRGDFVFE